MEPLKLIIVEDEEAHFELMKRAIDKEFPTALVHHFTDANTCMEIIGSINPDVILSDYLLPGMNGIELLKALKREHKEIPVIMITGQGDEAIAVQAMKLGAWDYLVKSVDFFGLLPGTIEKVVRERKLRESLHETERRFRDLAESTSDWIWEIDSKGRYTYSNPVVEKILGYSPDEVIGKYFHYFFSEKDKEIQVRAMHQAMAEKRPFSGLINCLIRKDACELIVETSGVPILDKAGDLLGYRGIDRDITMRKRAEEHISHLSQQLMKTQESERQRISRDLHDAIGQELSSLKIGIDTLLDDQPHSPPELKERVSRLSGMLQATITGVRDLAYTLRPAALDQLGLVRTIHQHCEEFSARHGVQVDFYAAGIDDLKLGFDTKITLYRLIQEGLKNIRKHAGACSIIIRLVASYPDVILRIEDNGRGFDLEDRLASAVNEKCLGLQSMKERVASLNGRMQIETRPMRGTRIRIEVPCREKNCGTEEDDFSR